MKETSRAWLLVPVVIVLAIAGIVAERLFTASQVPDCYPDPTRLGNPAIPSTVVQALLELEEMGMIPSAEDAFAEITSTGWVLDSADDYRLEYWIAFGDNTVGFAVNCITTEFGFNWEYDGLQVVPVE